MIAFDKASFILSTAPFPLPSSALCKTSIFATALSTPFLTIPALEIVKVCPGTRDTIFKTPLSITPYFVLVSSFLTSSIFEFALIEEFPPEILYELNVLLEFAITSNSSVLWSGPIVTLFFKTESL